MFDLEEKKKMVLEIIEEFKNNQIRGKQMALSGLPAINEIIDILNASIKSAKESGDEESKSFAEAKEYLEKAYREKKILDLLAQQADISYDHLSKVCLMVKRNEIDLDKIFTDDFALAEFDENQKEEIYEKWIDNLISLLKCPRIKEIEPLIELYENEKNPIMELIITGEESKEKDKEENNE